MLQDCSDELARTSAFQVETAGDRLCPHGVVAGLQPEWYAVAKLTAQALKSAQVAMTSIARCAINTGAMGYLLAKMAGLAVRCGASCDQRKR